MRHSGSAGCSLSRALRHRRFELAARGLRFHAVDDLPEHAHQRRDLYKASCVTLAALSAEVGAMRRDAEVSAGAQNDKDEP